MHSILDLSWLVVMRLPLDWMRSSSFLSLVAHQCPAFGGIVDGYVDDYEQDGVVVVYPAWRHSRIILILG